jgi:hypothetical protein
MKVLDQDYVDHDVTLGQLGSIVGNVTACNNLSFSDEDLPAEGKIITWLYIFMFFASQTLYPMF